MLDQKFTFHYDDAPLDVSFLFADEVPAGKHGFLQAKDSELVFEDGTKARFWGNLLNSAACFPEHAEADKVARRLAKFGVNLVRLHQFDAQWATPNIFAFTKGAPMDCTRKLDATSLDRLHYLVAALEREGIYVYVDLLVYRTFKAEDGVEAYDKLPPNGAKPYTLFDEHLIELQQEYARQLLLPVNPYTGKSLAEDPGVAAVLITNENDMFCKYWAVVIEQYASNLRSIYREWAKKNGVDWEPDAFDYRHRDPEPDLLRFYHEVQRNYCRRMRDFLRSIGVRQPIAGDSMCTGLPIISALQDMDLSCANVYWDLCGDQLTNKDLLRERRQVFGMVPSKGRTSTQPMLVTEWDQVWPNEWRAEAPLLVSSMAAFQGWVGTCLHTYRYRSVPTDCMGGTVLGSIAYRRNFETAMDPSKFGLFYAAAIMLRRGDVAQAKKMLDIRLTEDDVFCAAHGMYNHNLPNLEGTINCEKHGVRLVMPGNEAAPDAIGPDETGPAANDEEAGEVTSDTGELHRSWKKGQAWIDTARTKSIFGSFGAGEKVGISGLTITFRTDFATVTLTSLDNRPLQEATQILITAVGRSDNTGALYNATHTGRIDIGHGPVLYESIQADLELAHTPVKMHLWSIDQDGAYTGEIPVTQENNSLKFTIGKTFPSIYYLLTR